MYQRKIGNFGWLPIQGVGSKISINKGWGWHSLFLIRIDKEMAASKAFFLIICVIFLVLQPHMLVVCSFHGNVSLLML